MVDGLLTVLIPGCEGCQRAQVGQAETPIRPKSFPQPVHFFSRLTLIPSTQQGLRFIMRVEIQRDQCRTHAPADGDRLHGVVGGSFPVSCHGTVHAESRKDHQAIRFKAHRLCYGYFLFEGRPCLFPLLQGLTDTPQDSENQTEKEFQRKGSRQRDGVLRELERLFIGPHVHQSVCEAVHTIDLCPDVLDLS